MQAFVLFQRKCQSFQSSTFSCKSLEPDQWLFLNVTGVSFNTSAWATWDVNLGFANCQMETLVIWNVGRNKSNKEIHLHIKNSNIGSSVVVSDGVVTLENSSFHFLDFPDNLGVFSVTNGTVTVISSEVIGFQGHVFMRLTKGQAYFVDVLFMDCVFFMSAIYVKQNSSLHLQNTTFISNTGCLVRVMNFSVAIFSNSVLKNNTKPSHFGCYTILGGAGGSILWMKNSIFTNNRNFIGPLVAVLDRSVSVIQDSDITNNTAPHIGVVSVVSNMFLIFLRSKFSSNKGKAVAVESCSHIGILDCLFQSNNSTYAASIFVGVVEEMPPENKQEVKKMLHILGDLDYHFKRTTRTMLQTWFGSHQGEKCLISDCKFTDNTGGAFGAFNMSVVLHKCHFVNNTVFHHASSNSKGQPTGGAVSLGLCRANISECTFAQNSAEHGGAISADGGTLTVSSGVFTKNQVLMTKSSSGGAICIPSDISYLLVRKCVFLGNKAQNSGGAIMVVESTLVIVEESTFQDNWAQHGGAAFGESTFQDNWAQHGGAAFGAFSKIGNSSFNFNNADTDGGALVLIDQTSIWSSNFSHNTALNKGGAIHCYAILKFFCTFCFFKNNTGMDG